MFKHGQGTKGKRTLTYRSWESMKYRCLCSTAANYEYYGGRSIQVCKRWLKFENFFADMGERPTGLTLDRIDNDRDYEPNNCRWATQLQQNRNCSRNVNILFRGKACCKTDMAKRHGLSKGTLQYRLKAGWSLDKALLTPARHYNRETG